MMFRYSFTRIMYVLAMLIACSSAGAQEYVYVNTDNLVMRDRPEKTYKVFAILHAPCQLKIERMDEGYQEDKSVAAKYYPVGISFTDERGIPHSISGYVMKKYVVNSLSGIAVKNIDTTNLLSFTAVPHEEIEDPEEFNCGLYPQPKYKGGEAQFEAGIMGPKVYLEGPRGGCYYHNKNGNRVYVDKKFCKGRK
jgi:hypothetical protein